LGFSWSRNAEKKYYLLTRIANTLHFTIVLGDQFEEMRNVEGFGP
jgi:hypothetical protein